MRKTIIVFFLMIVGVFAFGGDNSTFVNLGFSTDGQYFMFGQYGVNISEQETYSKIFLVDVDKNNFVQDGVISNTYSSLPEPGQSSQGALFSLLLDSSSIIDQYEIDFIETGRLLYLYIDEKEENSTLNFRDYETGCQYSLVLNKTAYTDPVSSSFFIDITRTPTSGETETKIVGLPDYKRALVTDYTIDRVLFGPDNRSLIVVIAKHIQDDSGLSIRYMVESVQFN